MSTLSSRFAALNAAAPPRGGRGNLPTTTPRINYGFERPVQPQQSHRGIQPSRLGKHAPQRLETKQIRADAAKKASQSARQQRVNDTRGIKKAGGSRPAAAAAPVAKATQADKGGSSSKGRGRSRPRGGAKAKNEKNKGKEKRTPLNADTLDQEMEQYMMKDETTASVRLNDDLDAYMAEAKNAMDLDP